MINLIKEKQLAKSFLPHRLRQIEIENAMAEIVILKSPHLN